MVILHIVLLLLFSVLGLAGLIFKVDQAVFVGLALFPWEVRMILAGRGQHRPKLVKTLVLISTVVGLGYFLWQAAWLRAAALLGTEAYIYWVVTKPRKSAQG